MVEPKLGTPPVGGAFDLMELHGILKAKVMPFNCFREFFFAEETIQIFKNPSPVLQDKGYSILSSGLRLVFCDRTEHLLKYYFKDFHFDGVKKPWLAFTPYWAPGAIANHFGIERDYISEDYSFVVLSFARYYDSRNLGGYSGKLEINETVVSAANNVNVDNPNAIHDFLKHFGSHYIASFVTGDLIYQVFVYKKKFFKYFEKKLKDPAAFGPMTRQSLNTYLSPKYAKHIGRIGTASANDSIAEWADNNMKLKGSSEYKSLFKIALNDQVSRDVYERLKDNSLLGMELLSLETIFRNPEGRDIFNKIVRGNLKLYDNFG